MFFRGCRFIVYLGTKSLFMADKILFISVIIFATDDYMITPNNAVNGRQQEIYLPIDAISHITQREKGSSRAGYNVHIKKNYPLNAPFPVKSINSGFLTPEQVEVIK